MKYRFWCLKAGHIFETKVPRNHYQAFVKKCASLKRVCPHCKPENVQIFPLRDEEAKVYRCANNHINTISLFKDGMAHVLCNNSFTNFPETKGENAEDLVPKLVADGTIVCQYDGTCGAGLVPVDDKNFQRPGGSFIKTRVR
jgi:hypothetical protein